MASIEAVGAREILDSRGNPTVEVEVALDDGTIGRAAVPSGASTGAFEAVELRDGGSRYGGKGVAKAVDAVLDAIGPELVGFEASEQRLVDQRLLDLDGTPNKAQLGANAILGVSLAVARCRCRQRRPPAVPLRRRPQRAPAAGADDEHPQRRRARRHRRRRPGVHDRAHRCGDLPRGPASRAPSVYHALKSVLKEKGLATGLGDEGGFAPDLPNNREALDLISRRGREGGPDARRGHRPRPRRGRVEFSADGAYQFEGVREVGRRHAGLLRRPRRVVPDRLLEDPLDEEDWAGWQAMTAELGDRVQLVGDDLFVTNVERLAARHHRAVRQRPARQGQPDRLPHRDPRLGRPGAPQRLPLHDEPPLRRDRGHHDRRPRGRHQLRPDQDRCTGAVRAGREVQPAAPHRGGARRRRALRRPRRVPALRGTTADLVRWPAVVRRGGVRPLADAPRGQLPRRRPSHARRRVRPRGPARRSGPGPRGARRPASGAAARDAPARPRFTGRAAVLVLVLALLMVSYASSMRAYLDQRRHLADAEREHRRAPRRRSTGSSREKKRWHDPAYVRTMAHQRFGWVMPGEIGFQVLDDDGKPTGSHRHPVAAELGHRGDPAAVVAVGVGERRGGRQAAGRQEQASAAGRPDPCTHRRRPRSRIRRSR